MEQEVTLATATGTHVGMVKVPIKEGRRPEFVKIGERVYRHYMGSRAMARPEYRVVLGDFVELSP